MARLRHSLSIPGAPPQVMPERRKTSSPEALFSPARTRDPHLNLSIKLRLFFPKIPC